MAGHFSCEKNAIPIFIGDYPDISSKLISQLFDHRSLVRIIHHWSTVLFWSSCVYDREHIISTIAIGRWQTFYDCMRTCFLPTVRDKTIS